MKYRIIKAKQVTLKQKIKSKSFEENREKFREIIYVFKPAEGK